MNPLQHITNRINSLDFTYFSTTVARGGDFSQTSRCDTLFFHTLTLDSLLCASDDKINESIIHTLENTVRNDQSPHGSWNYWLRSSSEAFTRPLPDDLDTTSCALAALHKTANGISGHDIAHYVKLLTSRESEIGGPYRTWLVPKNAAPIWQDIDPVVNANIARFLHSLEAQTPQLIHFLETVLQRPQLISPYYLDRRMFLRILSSWYRGEYYPLLESECQRLLLRSLDQNDIHSLACSLTAYTSLREPDATLVQRASKELCQRLDHNPLPMETVCVDSIHKDRTDTAGSAAFTLALSRQAIFQSKEITNNKSFQSSLLTTHFKDTVVLEAMQWCESLPYPLSSACKNSVQRTSTSDTSNNTILLPFHLAAAATGAEDLFFSETYIDLAIAHFFGWIGYTTQDDVIDQDSPVKNIPIANPFLRQSYFIFANVSAESSWIKRCHRVFNEMDALNLYEQTAHRFDGKPTKEFSIAELTGRSSGMLLAPLAALKRFNASLELQHAVELFLTDVIAARQLCDDAHDWQHDLDCGMINSASAVIFKNGIPEDPTYTFWNESIDKIAERVFTLCDSARRHASIFAEGHQSFTERLLSPLERSMNHALKERTRAIDFISTVQADA